MTRVVLIDGENLLYGLRILMAAPGEDRASREVFGGFNFRGLIEELLTDEKPTEILWFGARLRQYDFTPELLEKTQKAIRMQARLVNLLQQQRITFIKVGYLRARATEPCSKCGQQEWKLTEKGVDVGLAARLMQEVVPDHEIVLMSADTDLLPAIRVVRKNGAKLMYVGYENRPINALSSQASTTRLITKPMVEKYVQQQPHLL